MRVVVSDTARAYIATHGGTVYVRERGHRCCTGSLRLLAATTKRPDDHHRFLPFPSDGLTVMLSSAGARPLELEVGMRGRRPAAYWDGCAYRL